MKLGGSAANKEIGFPRFSSSAAAAAAESALSFPSEKNVIFFLPLLDFFFLFLSLLFPLLSLFLKSEMPASDIAVKLCDRTEGRASEIRSEVSGLPSSRVGHDRLPKVQEIMLAKGPSGMSTGSSRIIYN